MMTIKILLANGRVSMQRRIAVAFTRLPIRNGLLNLVSLLYTMYDLVYMLGRLMFVMFTCLTLETDVDEYLVPMGDYTSLKDVVRDAAANGTNIVSFKSSPGLLRAERSHDVNGERVQLPNTTFMEAYNCDTSPLPKHSMYNRARKQIYRSDYVLYRFVHYSLVTKALLRTHNETPRGEWKVWFDDPTERTPLEATEAVMVHTKVIAPHTTDNYQQKCRYEDPSKYCPVGYPWPTLTHSPPLDGPRMDANGMGYNCYVNHRVDEYWVPRLRSALAQYSSSRIAM
jgi:hypothetical protein